MHPLFETWGELVTPDAQEMLDQLEQNRSFYVNQMPDEPESARSDDYHHNDEDISVTRPLSGQLESIPSSNSPTQEEEGAE